MNSSGMTHALADVATISKRDNTPRPSREGGNLSSDMYGQSLWAPAFVGMTKCLAIVVQVLSYRCNRHTREGGYPWDTRWSLWIPDKSIRV